jgi:hypothetical protein
MILDLKRLDEFKVGDLIQFNGREVIRIRVISPEEDTAPPEERVFEEGRWTSFHDTHHKVHEFGAQLLEVTYRDGDEEVSLIEVGDELFNTLR